MLKSVSWKVPATVLKNCTITAPPVTPADQKMFKTTFVVENGVTFTTQLTSGGGVPASASE
jgi:hypothetical protein